MTSLQANNADNNMNASCQVKSDFMVSEAAKMRIQKVIKERGKGIGIRVGITTTGCSGKAYTLEYVDDVKTEDRAFPFAEGLAVYIDPKALPFLKGTTLDYIRRGLNEGFEFKNPNERGRCGCGESFNV